MTKLEALKLLKASDHAFIGKEGVDEIGKAFGVRLPTYLAYANPQDFKGLSLYDKDGNPIDEAEGQDADVVAMTLCDKLDLHYQTFFGRGSQLRECCRVLEEEKPSSVNPQLDHLNKVFGKIFAK